MRRVLLAALAAAALAVPARALDLDHTSMPAPALDLDHASTAVPMAGEAASATDSILYKAWWPSANPSDQPVSNVGMTITNYGFWGNNFGSRAPSLEYPMGSGYEHLVRGGLWIGAVAFDAEKGEFYTSVVTGTVDGATGQTTANATEFTPAGNAIDRRSSLGTSDIYDPAAVSELDVRSFYSDRPAKTALGTTEKHRPLNVLVTQRNYAWAFADYGHVLFFHFTIKNLGPPLQNVWVGAYNEFASGNKNAYSVWPPSSSGGPGSWFSKKWIQYDADTTRMLREHFCLQKPVPSGCRLESVPYWIGLAFLGVKPGSLADTSSKKTTLAAWGYAPGSALRDTDLERYALMNSGLIQPLVGDSLEPETGDPVTLQSVGPFPTLLPGDSIQVDFAIIGGPEPADLRRRKATAQRAYDLQYRLPIPPPSPRLKIVPRDGALDYFWDDSAQFVVDSTSTMPDKHDFEGYRVYIGNDRLDDSLKCIAQFDLALPVPHDSTGFNTGLGPDTSFVVDGQTYRHKFTVPALRNGFKYYCAVTSYDIGTTEVTSLESGKNQNKTLAIPAPAAGERPGQGVVVFPNPYRVEARWDQGAQVRSHYLWFANLPERCTIRIYTLSGDMVYSTDFDGGVYRGQNARGISDPARDLPATLSGRMFGWDMITDRGQAAATGLYLYSVEDRAGGKRSLGKFLIVKSDREGF